MVSPDPILKPDDSGLATQGTNATSNGGKEAMKMEDLIDRREMEKEII